MMSNRPGKEKKIAKYRHRKLEVHRLCCAFHTHKPIGNEQWLSKTGGLPDARDGEITGVPQEPVALQARGCFKQLIPTCACADCQWLAAKPAAHYMRRGGCRAAARHGKTMAVPDSVI